MGDLQRAAELTYGDLPKLEEELKPARPGCEEVQSGTPLLKEEVGAEDIAEVVAPGPGSRSAGCSRARPRS